MWHMTGRNRFSGVGGLARASNFPTILLIAFAIVGNTPEARTVLA